MPDSTSTPDLNLSPSHFSDDLEARARRLTEHSRQHLWRPSPLSVIERDLTLILDQLSGSRELHEALLEDLVRETCYIKTELLAIKQRTPPYSRYQFPEREKFLRRLTAIASERRKLHSKTQDRLHDLQSRLLSLLNQHSILSPSHNGYPRHRKKA